ncbi:hypothetical protein [Nocardia sp. NBC_01388]|uniref:hypothetical protein n=1 Tax=Nocardia sp. NBC_01388 TaxID=2903596 RepID=UPI003250ABC4
MAVSQPGRRAGRTATRALLALGVAGTIGASATAYSDTDASHASTPAVGTGSRAGQSDSPGADSGTSGGTVPQIQSGTGGSHARSSGS